MASTRAPALAALIALASCGGGTDIVDESTPTPSESPSPSPTESPSPSPSPSPTIDAEALAIFERCEEDLAPFLESLQELDSRLNIGMVVAEYRVAVQDVRIAYDRTPWKNVDFECVIAAGVRLEKALNAYVRALNVWEACVSDFGCDTDSITPRLQKEWQKATRFINQGERKIRGLKPKL